MSKSQLRIQLLFLIVLIFAGMIINLAFKVPSPPAGPASLSTRLFYENPLIAKLVIANGVGLMFGFLFGVVGWIGLFLVKNWGRILFFLSQLLILFSMAFWLVIRSSNTPAVIDYLNSRPPKPFVGELFGYFAAALAVWILISVYTKIGAPLFEKNVQGGNSNVV